MTPPLDPADLAAHQQCVGSNLRRVARLVTHCYDARLRTSGLRLSQLDVLVALARRPGTTITALADQLSLDRTTLSRNLQPLEKQGLVESVPGRDRRTRRVSLSVAGSEKLAEAMPLWRAAYTHFLDAFGADRWAALLQELDQIAALAHPPLPDDREQ